MIGIYSYHYWVTYYFVFGMLGLNNYRSREIRDDNEKRNETFCSIYGFR